MQWAVWSLDVDQAYLQSGSPLRKDVLCKTKQINLDSDEYLQLQLALYGLSESGDYWSETLAMNHTQDLGFPQAFTDPSLFYRIEDGKLTGISGTYVDDILRCAPSPR